MNSSCMYKTEVQASFVSFDIKRSNCFHHLLSIYFRIRTDVFLACSVQPSTYLFDLTMLLRNLSLLSLSMIWVTAEVSFECLEDSEAMKLQSFCVPRNYSKQDRPNINNDDIMKVFTGTVN